MTNVPPFIPANNAQGRATYRYAGEGKEAEEAGSTASIHSEEGREVVQETTSLDGANVIDNDTIFLGWLQCPSSLGLGETVGNVVIASLLCCLLALVMAGSGPLWAVAVTWVSATLGGSLAKMTGLPPLLGMIVSGMIHGNLPGEWATKMPPSWSACIRASGLTIILLRSGLDLDLDAIRNAGTTAAKLTLLPGIAEAITCALAASAFLGMPPFLALSLGFMLAAVSPAVVVVGMLNLQEAGWGVDKGIPSLVIAAAAFDDVAAIAGFSLCLGLATKSANASHFESILHGPLTLVFGLLVGFGGACVMACTRIWKSRWKRTLSLLSLGLVLNFGMTALHYQGSGALGALIMAMGTSLFWKTGRPRFLSVGVEGRYIAETEHDLSVVWAFVSEPLLFGTLGVAMEFGMLTSTGWSFAVILLGLCARLPTAYFATGCSSLLTRKERAFVALAWLPKATVQAALCSVPLDLLQAQADKNDEGYEQTIGWGYDILSTAILSILITAPLGLMAINFLGPVLLEKGGNTASQATSTGSQLTNTERGAGSPGDQSSGREC